MENEPVLSIRGSVTAITLYENEDGVWVISDHDSGVTTQAETKYEALLMLADALSGYDDADIDLLESAEDIFVRSEEMKEFIENVDS